MDGSTWELINDKNTFSNLRVLIIIPEVTYRPDRIGNLAIYITAKAGGLADVSIALVTALFNQGAGIHVAIPDYSRIFIDRVSPLLRKELQHIDRFDPSRYPVKIISPRSAEMVRIN